MSAPRSFMDDIREYHAALEAAGHKLIRDADGHIDTFRLDIDEHNGPECERCGQTWCHHCMPAIEPCVPKVPKPPPPNDPIAFNVDEAERQRLLQSVIGNDDPIAVEPMSGSSPVTFACDDVPSREPPDCFIFADEGKEIGRLSWADGTLRFTGNADESAKVFFEALKRMTQ